MPYLYVLNGRARHRVFPVGEKPAGETIGQRDDAELRIADPWISWTHAKVVRDAGGRVAIEDLGSTNGTYVNCERVQRQALAEDDVVFLGRTHLLFVASSRAPSAPPSTSRATRESTTRLVVPGAPQDLPALDASQDSRLLSASRESEPEPPGSDTTTDRLGSPFTDAGRIAELDAADDEGIPLPPTARVAIADPRPSASASDDHIEIDIEELGLAPPRRASGSASGSGERALEPVRVHSDGSGGYAAEDAGDPRDRELATLRASLRAREDEIRRLRAELTKLKEQYLDL